MRIAYKSASFVLLTLALTGCGQSPLEKLKSNQSHSELTKNFWMKQMQDKTNLWQEAKIYCMQYPQKENCQSVDEVIVMQMTQ